MKKVLISYQKLADHIEQQGVTLRNSKHIKIMNPKFEDIEETFDNLEEKRDENGHLLS